MAFEWVNPKNGRWYAARLARDLFGEPAIERAWGGKGRPPSGTARDAVADMKTARTLLRDLARRRRAHGYLPAQHGTAWRT